MIYIFDLDYTLFKTKKFSKDIASIFNLNWADFEKSCLKHFKDRNINYNPYKHLSILIKEGEIKRQEALKIRMKIIEIMKNANKYVFRESETILKELEKRRDKLILISFGDIFWQKQKIANLKIKRYFFKIIITDKAKNLVLDSLKKVKERKVIINDNAQESFLIKKELGKAEIILIKGPYAKNIKHKLRAYKLKEVLTIIS